MMLCSKGNIVAAEGCAKDDRASKNPNSVMVDINGVKVSENLLLAKRSPFEMVVAAIHIKQDEEERDFFQQAIEESGSNDHEDHVHHFVRILKDYSNKHHAPIEEKIATIDGVGDVRSYWITGIIIVECLAQTVPRLVNVSDKITSIADDTPLQPIYQEKKMQDRDDAFTEWPSSGMDFHLFGKAEELSNLIDGSKDEENRRLQSTLDEFMNMAANSKTAPSLIRPGIPEAWFKYNVTGEGLTLGVIFLGSSLEHENIAYAYRGLLGGQPDKGTGLFDHNYNWYEPYNANQREPSDPFNLGTWVTGTAVGRTNLTGVAFGSQFISCRGISLTGQGTLEGYSTCFQFMVAPFDLDGENERPDLRPDVVLMPFVCSSCLPGSLLNAIQRLNAAGILPVGESTIGIGDALDPLCNYVDRPPSTYDETFTIGGYNTSTFKSWYQSGTGPSNFTGNIKPDMLAPGTGISVPFVTQGQFLYAAADSPALSASIVAGSSMLVMEACPNLKRDPMGIRQLLTTTAVPIPIDPFREEIGCVLSCPVEGKCQTGAGGLRVDLAIDLCIFTDLTQNNDVCSVDSPEERRLRRGKKKNDVKKKKKKSRKKMGKKSKTGNKMSASKKYKKEMGMKKSMSTSVKNTHTRMGKKSMKTMRMMTKKKMVMKKAKPSSKIVDPPTKEVKLKLYSEQGFDGISFMFASIGTRKEVISYFGKADLFPDFVSGPAVRATPEQVSGDTLWFSFHVDQTSCIKFRLMVTDEDGLCCANNKRGFYELSSSFDSVCFVGGDIRSRAPFDDFEWPMFEESFGTQCLQR